MSWVKTKAEEIATVLKTIPGLANVYAKDRWTIDPKLFRKLFCETVKGIKERVNTWMVGRESFREGRDYQVRYVSIHTFVIKGFYSFNEEEASYDQFQDLIELIQDTLRGNQTIWDSCSEEVEETTTARLIAYDFFGEVFTHYCEIALEVERHVIKT